MKGLTYNRPRSQLNQRLTEDWCNTRGVYNRDVTDTTINDVFTTFDGLQLFVRHWRCPTPKAHIVLVHGIGEHCDRFGGLVAALNAASFSVHAFDHRGHGRSPGRRGHVEAWSDYQRDLRAFLTFLSPEVQNRPIMFIGHSMGALVVLDHLIDHPNAAHAAVIMAAPIQPCSVAHPWKIGLARILNRCWPRFTMPLGIDPRELSNDPAHVKASILDTLTHGRVTARWGVEVLAEIERVKREAERITTPLLILHGAADRINDCAGSAWLAEHIATPQKRLIVYQGARHELHSDIVRECVSSDVVNWLSARVDAAD